MTATAVRALGIAVVALAIAGCGLSSHESYEVTGTVLALEQEQAQVRIAHDDIPGFMNAMTMNFDVAGPDVLDGVQPGHRVRFVLERSPGKLEITSLEITGEAGLLEDDGGFRAPPEVAPGFELTDQSGRPFRLEDLRGRAVLIDFIFTNCPGPCPILTASMVQVQRRLGDDLSERVHFVSVSLDPERDTPAALTSYASRHGADLGNWSFVTGAVPDVERVLMSYGVGKRVLEDGEIDHLVATMLIDPEGRIVERYLGLSHKPADVIEDIERILG